MRFNIHEAKTQFSRLVAAVEAGEKVTICRNGKPVIECIPAAATTTAALFGAWGRPPETRGDGEHLVKPTDDALLDEMDL